MFLILALAAPLLIIYIAIFLARCYAVVLTQSSSGQDRVRWASESYQEWLGEGWPVLLTFAGVTGLTSLVAIPGANLVVERWQTIAVIVGAATFVLVVFPFVLCVSQHPPLIALLPYRFGSMLRVWAMTLPLAAAAGFGVAMSLGGYIVGPFVVALLGPPAILVHARAWGRLVWLVLNERTGSRRRRSRSPVPECDPVPASDLELETAIKVVKSAESATPRAAAEEDGYALETSDWKPTPTHLAEHYEMQRESDRWDRLHAGEENADPLGRVKRPRPWTALAPERIFGILLDADTAVVCAFLAIGLGFLSAILLSIPLF